MEHDKYMSLNSKYLHDAETLLERGDYPQASEKFWGAVATGVKAMATMRRWRHSTHRDLRVIVDRLYRETRDQELLRLFSTVESLHANFYEDFASPEAVRAMADDARRLIGKLEALAK